jgi:dipeptidyl aminopeptidase/acylaminoacyl peptidase
MAYQSYGMHVLLLCLGGYGGTEGEPSEQSSYLDAMAAFKWLQMKLGGIEAERVLAHGLSIGAAMAFALAVRFPGVHVCCVSRWREYYSLGPSNSSR